MTDNSKRWSRAEIDDVIAKWNRDFNLATKNILELMSDPTYVWLAGEGSHPPAQLEGLTESEVRPAIKKLDELWQLFPVLKKLLEDVNQLHQNLGFFGMYDDLLEIQRLIEGKSIEIVIKTTYEQRGLLTPDEITRAATPRQILQSMIDGYDRVKAIVVKVSNAIARIDGRLNQITDEVVKLRNIAVRLSESVLELNSLETKVTALREKIYSDPMSVADDADQTIRPAITTLQKRLEELQIEHTRVESALSLSDGMLTELEEAFIKASTANEERIARLLVEKTDNRPELFTSAVIDDLQGWLDRLKTTFQQGRWHAATLGMDNWKVQVDARLTQCRSVTVENERLINRRQELRGLLDSLRAKAVDTGMAEDESLNQLYNQAYELLYSRPTPMETVENLVSRYMAEVR